MTVGIDADLHFGILPFHRFRYRYSIGETDATTALRRHIRSVTIMGMDENGLPAFSHTLDDVPENVNGYQVADIVEMVTELIRQS